MGRPDLCHRRAVTGWDKGLLAEDTDYLPAACPGSPFRKAHSERRRWSLRYVFRWEPGVISDHVSTSVRLVIHRPVASYSLDNWADPQRC